MIDIRYLFDLHLFFFSSYYGSVPVVYGLIVMEVMNAFGLPSLASEAKKRRLERYNKLKAKRARVNTLDPIPGIPI